MFNEINFDAYCRENMTGYLCKWLMLCSWGIASVSSSIHFNLTILHTNDIHSHFEETNVYGYRCRQLSDPCYGGFARLVHQTREIRQREPNSIYIDGGDLYQGTVWYSIHKWRISAHFANLLNLTAMVIMSSINL